MLETIPTTSDSPEKTALALVQLGDLDAASKAVEQGIERAGSDRSQRAFWHFRFLRAEVLRMRGSHAKALDYLNALGSPAEWDVTSRTELAMHQGYNTAILGHFARADKLLKRAEDQAVREDLVHLRDEVKVRQAMVAYLKKDYSTSEKLYRSVAETQSKEYGWFLVTIALGGVGKSLMAQKRFQEALPWLEEALGIANSVNAKFRASLISGEIGICYRGLGNLEKALELHLADEKILSELGALHAYQVCLADIGNVYLDKGEHLTAIAYYRRALALAQKIKAPASIEKWNFNIRLAYEKLRESLR